MTNGTNIWASCAHQSGWVFLLARTNPDAPRDRGISFLLVAPKTLGISIKPLI